MSSPYTSTLFNVLERRAVTRENRDGAYGRGATSPASAPDANPQIRHRRLIRYWKAALEAVSEAAMVAESVVEMKLLRR